VLGRDAPCVSREIDKRVDKRLAGALVGQSADQAIGVDPVGRAKIGHAEQGLVRKPSGGGQHGRVSRLERCALRERVPSIVVRHAREVGTI
jgi:hypothetical protein